MERTSDPESLLASTSLSTDGPGQRLTAASAAILGLVRDAAIRDLVAEIAIEHGYGFYCAADITDALRVIAEEPPGLVLVDIDVNDGRALVRQLHRDDRWQDLTNLAITASNDSMAAVTLDVPVFFKPGVDGLEEALVTRLSPVEHEPGDGLAWAATPPPTA